MDIRDQILYSAKVSTWDRYGAPSTMIVVDDYSGALERMPTKRKSEVVSEVKSLAMDGAKFGLNLMIGLQKPTWENIDTTIRSQMGRIVYSVDAGDSRIALGEEGAERLPAQWNFLTRMTDDSSMQRGVGFVLQDAEIEAFLKSRPVAQNEQPDWIDAQVVREVPMPVAVESGPDITTSRIDEFREQADKTIQIQDLYRDYLERQVKPNFAQIQRTVFGKTGGSFYESVIKAIADFEGCQTTEVNAIIEGRMASWGTTTVSTTPEMGDFAHNIG
jgi:DNA segregation ATPase FtsK/SpoIIIE-like protein